MWNIDKTNACGLKLQFKIFRKFKNKKKKKKKKKKKGKRNEAAKILEW